MMLVAFIAKERIIRGCLTMVNFGLRLNVNEHSVSLYVNPQSLAGV